MRGLAASCLQARQIGGDAMKLLVLVGLAAMVAGCSDTIEAHESRDTTEATSALTHHLPAADADGRETIGRPTEDLKLQSPVALD